MPFQVTYTHFPTHVLMRIDGDPGIEELLDVFRQAGAQSVNWKATACLTDLRGITRDYSFTEQLRIGQAVAGNLGHLQKLAAVVQPERITRVGEKSARHHGARAMVFASEDEAVRWFRGDATG